MRRLPAEVTQQGVIVQPGTTAPFMLLDLYSPTGAYDNIFLANYATINLQYALTRISGVSQVQIFGAGPYAMRIWVNPDRLASLGVTVSDITNAVKAQNKVNPPARSAVNPFRQGNSSLITFAHPDACRPRRSSMRLSSVPSRMAPSCA